MPAVELTYQGKTPISRYPHTSYLPQLIPRIAAISSYITLTNSHIYSIGGPTGEVHAKPDETSTTGFGEKVQEVLFVPEGELEGWDKTNKALVSLPSLSGSCVADGIQRYGAHGIEFDPNGRAYIPDLYVLPPTPSSNPS